MDRIRKYHFFIALGVAALFYWFFMFAKHDPSLSAVAPFIDDPYDAVGSFALIGSLVLLVLAGVRAFRPYPNGLDERHKRFLDRTNAAIPLFVLIAVTADIVAMVRHPAAWVHTASTMELATMMLIVLAVGAFALWVISYTSRRSSLLPHASSGNAFIMTALGVLLLSVYPESLIKDLIGHLATIVFGILALFGIAGALLPVFIPVAEEEDSRPRSRRTWLYAIIVAIAVGLTAFLGESSEGGGIPASKVLLVFGVFVGVGAFGILAGYALMGKALGVRR